LESNEHPAIGATIHRPSEEITTDMIRTVNALCDRLLARVVPPVTVHADCGEYYEPCGPCLGLFRHYRLCCRSTGACGACRYYTGC
jgi:hypothetical protein